jgi:hypothetical protein
MLVLKLLPMLAFGCLIIAASIAMLIACLISYCYAFQSL